jgi:DNA (cytosine-5)-methyltransferase 1
MQQLVLSLFPGVDLLARAFKEVWGPDISIVHGSDPITGGDIRQDHYPAGKFDGVFGGPPCQCFSRLAHMVRQNGYEPKFGNLIPEFERVCFETQPKWWLMENVPDAPKPHVEGYAAWSCLLNNRQLGEDQNRVRRWTFGVKGLKYKVLMIDTVALESKRFEYAATGAGRVAVPVAIGGSGKPKRNKVGRIASKDTLSMGTQRSQAGFLAVKALQGLSADFDLPGWTVEAKVKAVANGVPMSMGRALAKAVKEVMEN